MPPTALQTLAYYVGVREKLFRRIQLMYDISADDEKEADFLIRCEKLDETYTEFDDITNKILNVNALVASEDQIKDTANIQESFETLFFKIQVVYRTKKAQQDISVIDHVTANNTHLNANLNHEPRSFAKLPQLNIPKFSGENLEEFDSFISLYDKIIHTRENLAEIEKYSYLVSLLEGPALKIVQAVQFSAQNYQIAYTRLTERYQNPRVLANYYANKVLDTKVFNSETLQGLRSFLDQIHVNVQSLRALNLVDLSDFLFLHIGLRTLDSRTRQLFENEHVRIKNIPSFTDLITFVKNRCSVLEMSDSSSASSSSGNRPQVRFHGNLNHTKRSYVSFGASESTRANPAHPISTKSNSRVSSLQTPNFSCSLCKGPHRLLQCSSFLNKTPDARYTFVKSAKRCFACLGTHTLSDCNSSFSCKHCKSKSHHTLLHFDSLHVPNIRAPGTPPRRVPTSQVLSQVQVPSTPRVETQDVPSGSDPIQTLSCNAETHDNETQVLLGTAQVRILDVFGNFHSARVCVDLGSQLNLITASMANKLNLHRRHSSTRVSGVGNSTPMAARGLVSCNIVPTSHIHPQVSFNAIVLPTIASDMPTLPVARNSLDVFGDKLADPQYYKPGPVDILLGAQVVSEIIDTQSRVIKGSPSVLPTIFGYVLFGNIPSDFPLDTNPITLLNYNTQSLFVSSCNEDPLSSQLRQFFELENNVPNAPCKLSPDDERCEKFFNETTTRSSDGKYVCRLPFKPSLPPILGSTRNVATSRLLKLETRLGKNENFKRLYHENLQDYLDNGHMELARTPSPYLLTHHGILKETTSSCRVVFNASEPSDTNQSLNSNLLIGPKLQSNISDVILNFRTYPVALTCDIRQMYRCINLDPRDRRYQHILWRFNSLEPISEYELTTLSFGLSCSPYLAQKVLQKLAKDEGSNYKLGSESILSCCYIDDFVTGSYSVDEATLLQKELIDLLARGGFSLRKWASSHPQVLQGLDLDHLEKPHVLGNSESIKILGLQWDPNSDSFFYVVSPEFKDAITKRDVLSQIARFYDIQGFLSPVIVWLKIFMQKLWLLGTNWDSTLPADLDEEWRSFVQELPLLNEVKIPRYIGTYRAQVIDLVGLCDASASAFAAVCYLRVTLSGGEVRLFLIRSRSRVSPLSKPLTIPKLELSAACLLADLLKSLNPLIRTLNISNTYLFSDSTIVLGWLKTPAYLLNTFVSNRVTQILEVTSPTSWYHIKSGENSADIASRGCFPSKIIPCDLWWHGPGFLQLPTSQWPCISSGDIPNLLNDLPEIKSQSKISLTTQYASSEYLHNHMSRFSSLIKLHRVYGWLLRFIHNSRNRSNRISSESLMASEMTTAMSLCIKLTQHTHFQVELVCLAKGHEIKGSLVHLSPFISESGLLSVGGRLKNAPLPSSSKHPVLIPRSSHLATLIVDHFHIYALHAGPQLVQSLVQKQYWIGT